MDHPRDLHPALVRQAADSEGLVVSDQMFDSGNHESQAVTWECQYKRIRLSFRLDGTKLIATKTSSGSVSTGLGALRKGLNSRLDFDLEHTKSESSKTFIFDMRKGCWLSGAGSLSNNDLAKFLCDWLVSAD